MKVSIDLDRVKTAQILLEGTSSEKHAKEIAAKKVAEFLLDENMFDITEDKGIYRFRLDVLIPGTIK